MKTLVALTLSATVCFATPAHANPVTDAMQQLAANQLAEIKVAVAQQARQAMDKTANDLRQLMQAEPQVAQGKKAVANADAKPAAE